MVLIYRRLTCGAAALFSVYALAGQSASAGYVGKYSSSAFSVITTNDILLNASPTFASPLAPSGAEGTSTSWSTFTDGAAPDGNAAANSVTSGSSLTYILPVNVNVNSRGFNVSSLDVYSGWGDNGRADQNYTISYSTTSDSTTFVPLETVTYAPSSGHNSNPFDEHVHISDAPSNVAALKIDFGSQENGYVGYKELVATATVASSGPAVTLQPNVPIANHSFEVDPTDGSAGYKTITGWVHGGQGGAGTNDASGPFAPIAPVPDGSKFAFLQVATGNPGDTSSLTQTLNGLLLGAKYRLTYYDGTRNGNQNGDSTISVSVGGVGIGSDQPGLNSQPWTLETIDFTYTGSASLENLTFTDTNSTNHDDTVVLDNVQIIPLPEPVSGSIFGVAGLFLLAKRRRAGQSA